MNRKNYGKELNNMPSPGVPQEDEGPALPRRRRPRNAATAFLSPDTIKDLPAMKNEEREKELVQARKLIEELEYKLTHTVAPAEVQILKKEIDRLKVEREALEAEHQAVVAKAQDELDQTRGRLEETEREKEQLSERQNAIVLTMPVSRKEVSFRLVSIDPAHVDVSPLNPRKQELLDSGSVRDIFEDIRENGQVEPGMVRPVEKGGSTRFELISGSRRLFCVTQLGRQYLAYVGQVPDADIRMLSRTENKQSGISAWERGVSYKEDLDAGRYKSYELLAKAEGTTKATISNYIQVAELPEVFVRAFPTPNELTMSFAAWLSKKRTDAQRWQKLLAKADELANQKQMRLEKGIPVMDADTIKAELKRHIRGVTETKPTARRPVTYMDGRGTARFKHSVSNKGAYKFELITATEEQQAMILKYIQETLKADAVKP